ncbi:MAG: ferrochelatase [Planctomycetaceae bacterium]|nr:ferrochelatase [Planctomycetaceae bacterium]
MATVNYDAVNYDAVLIIGFGGPERREDVIPFLENVLRGRNVPRERMLAVAEHYYQFGGKSPINDQVRELINALRIELDRREIDLPIEWGNRNWHPMLTDTLQDMADAGKRRAIGLVLAAYSSYSSCRQYRENVEAAVEHVGANAPVIDKIRVFYNHPDFIAANADHLRQAVEQFSQERRGNVHVAYTAHSIPASMANSCDYEQQLLESCRLVSEASGIAGDHWKLAYQSRSGRPQDPWLEPDICDHLRKVNEEGVSEVVVHPIGFLSDHLEVLYDLDEEAQQAANTMGMQMMRAATVGTHPAFVSMLGELIAERLSESSERRAIGQYKAGPDICPLDCCPAPIRRPPQTQS